MGIGREVARAEVPFAGKEVRVTGLAQRLGDRHFLEREMISVRGRQQLASLDAANEIRDARADRIFPRHNAGSRRRTNTTSRISLREPHAVGGEAIKVRRLIEGAAVAAKIGPPKIISEDKDDVRTPGSGFDGFTGIRAGEIQLSYERDED